VLNRTAPRILAVASGKGGVGKTNLAANLAVNLSAQGHRVLLFDADLGLANVDVLFGLAPRHNVHDVLKRTERLQEIVVQGPEGVSIIPASSGVTELVDLPAEEGLRLAQELTALAASYDMLIVDAPAGIGGHVMRFCAMADQVLLITTPEPTAITDAYALVKVLQRKRADLPIRLVVNMVGHADEGERVARAFGDITGHFLGRSVPYLGSLPWDTHVPLAVRRQKPFVTCYPNVRASYHLKQISQALVGPREQPRELETSPFPNRVARWLDSWTRPEGERL
jgi:flagellar biosynthesis protein FlhG